MSSSETETETEDFRRPLIPASKKSSSSSSCSSSSSATSDDSSEDDTGSVVPDGPWMANRLESIKYNGFLRKPKSKHDAVLARKRQERSYSDSDNSYEHNIPIRGIREEREPFDLEINADSESGRRSLFENMEANQVESLVAWAHSGTSTTAPASSHAHVGTLLPETGQEDEEAMMRNNPLLHLVNTPLPLSFLNYFAHRATNVPEFHEGLYTSFEDSALVAIGMIMEEIITASLLPLAGCHVLRCRQLEAKPSKDETLLAPISEVSLLHPISNQPIKFDPRNLPEDETSFSAWTLPPEEAMLKMVSQGMVPDTGIPLVRDPIRSCGTRGDKGFQVRGNKHVVHQIFEDVCKNNKTVLAENKELLDLFLVAKKYKRKRAPRASGGGDITVQQSEEPANKKPRMMAV